MLWIYESYEQHWAWDTVVSARFAWSMCMCAVRAAWTSEWLITMATIHQNGIIIMLIIGHWFPRIDHFSRIARHSTKYQVYSWLASVRWRTLAWHEWKPNTAFEECLCRKKFHDRQIQPHYEQNQSWNVMNRMNDWWCGRIAEQWRYSVRAAKRYDFRAHKFFGLLSWLQ